MGTRCADHVTPRYPQKLALTSPTGGGRSVGIVRSRTKATEFSLVFVTVKPRHGSPSLSVHVSLWTEFPCYNSILIYRHHRQTATNCGGQTVALYRGPTVRNSESFCCQVAGARLHVRLLVGAVPSLAGSDGGLAWRRLAGPGCWRRQDHRGDGASLQHRLRHRDLRTHAVDTCQERISVSLTCN